MRRPVLLVAGAALLMAATACSGSDAPDPAKSDRGAPNSGTPNSGTTVQSGRFVKEGYFGAASTIHARLEIARVERHSDKSVLRFTMTSLESERKPVMNRFGTGAGDFFNIRMPLVDSVGRKMYQPLEDSRGSLGSKLVFAEPGVRYETVVYYPPIPESVRTVTVITPGTAGEFAGVPVVPGSGHPGPTAPSDVRSPAPGAAVAWPLREVTGPIKSSTPDLYDITEGEVKERTSSGTEERVGLRTDVLFAFNSAELSDKAKAVLDEVATETRSKADPAKPPIAIAGHTDSKGADGYNLRLSQQRAEAVRKELETRLGTDYRYQSTGKGEAEPIAKEGGPDDARARARNRRVEISYQIKRQTPGATTSATAQPDTAPAAAAATFRPQDGPTVASRSAQFRNNNTRRIDVKSFYRDGAYLVAVFDIVNLGPKAINPGVDYGDLDYAGGDFTSFGVIDPATKNTYRAVRVGPDQAGIEDYVEPGWATFRTEVLASNRGFFYVPAPPGNLKSVTFDAGPFGTFPGVPIR